MEWVLVEEKVYVPKYERGCVKFAVPNAFGNFDTASNICHMRQSLVLF